MREEKAARKDYNKLSIEEFDGAPCNGCPYCTISTRGGSSGIVGYYCSYGIQNCYLYARWWHKKNASWQEDLEKREETIQDVIKENEELKKEFRYKERELSKEKMALEIERDRIKLVKADLKHKKRIIQDSEIEYEKFKKFVMSKRKIIASKEKKVDEMLLSYRDEKEKLLQEKEELEAQWEEIERLKDQPFEEPEGEEQEDEEQEAPGNEEAEEEEPGDRGDGEPEEN